MLVLVQQWNNKEIDGKEIIIHICNVPVVRLSEKTKNKKNDEKNILFCLCIVILRKITDNVIMEKKMSFRKFP